MADYLPRENQVNELLAVNDSHFLYIVFFIFIFILLRRVALQPELFYKGPST